MRHLLVFISTCVLLSESTIAQSVRTDVAPLVESSCLHCHDEETTTGLNFNSLGYNLSDTATFRMWEQVFDRVHDGDMPPKAEDRPNSKHVATALRSLQKNLDAVSRVKQLQSGRVPARRLTKLELGYTYRDLLLIDGDVTSGLPDRVESGSFDTVGSTQRISRIHMSSYLQAADEALDLAIQMGPNPYQQKEFDFLNNPFMNAFHDVPLSMGGNVTRKLEDGVAMFIDADYLTRATNFGFFVRTPGVYQITSTIAAFQSAEPVTAKLILREPGGGAALLAAVDLPPDTTETMDVATYLRPGDDFYLTMETGRTIVQDFTILHHAGGAKNYQGPGIAIKSQNVKGPLPDSWPPESTRQLLHGLKLTPADKSDQTPYEVEVSVFTLDQVAAIIEHFAPRVFRRPPGKDELQPFVDLAARPIEEGRDMVNVLRVPLRSMLSSPQFLLFGGEPGRLNDFALANRLSYFLWKSMPDEKLFALAKNGRLSDENEFTRQVDRMLDDEKSSRFLRDFLGQWLRLNKVNATTPDATLYPEYDELLGSAIPKETELFFGEMLKENLSATNLIDSDFTFVNSRLATHYGIPHVTGQHFRRISLPADSPRGGVLTQAAILKTTANGTVTSPVLRGNFVLTNFLGTPPSPPPQSVGSIEPDTQGKTTIREVLAAHRNIQQCNKCHREIDPPGFALESFDPIGGFRTHYRATAGKTYTDGLTVDSSGVTDDGKTFADIREFKRHLLDRKEQVARNFVSQLIVYSTGGEIQFADREEVEAILNRTRKHDFPVRDIVHEVVQSRMFQHK